MIKLEYIYVNIYMYVYIHTHELGTICPQTSGRKWQPIHISQYSYVKLSSRDVFVCMPGHMAIHTCAYMHVGMVQHWVRTSQRKNF